MTVTYGFYDSLNGDRVYNAGQMSKIFQGIISDGVMTSVGNGLSVTNNAGSMNINVASGRAWFKNTWTYNDATIVLTPDAAEPVLNRIDSVIVEVNTDINSRVNTIKILKGTPGSSPVPPTLTNTATLGQYPLADIYIAAGVTAITQANITNRIGTAACPIASALVPAFDFSLLEQQYIAQFNAWFTDLQNELDANQATNLQNQINSLESEQDGWQPLGATPVYVSKDDSTGVVNVPADVTAKINEGMRLRYEQAQALTAYWDLNANSNSQVGSFNGTDTAISYSAGKFGNAATFNGTTSKIVISDSATLKPTGDFTVGMWIKTSVTNSYKHLFQSFSQNTNLAGVVILIDATNVINVIIGKNTGTTLGSDYSSVYGKVNVTDNAFHYVVVTYKSNYLQIYVDGVLDVSSYVVQPAYAATNYVRIGARNNSGSDISLMSGQIDDVFFINGYALDERTILNKYRANTAQGTSNITVKKHALITNVGNYSGGNTPVTFWGGTDFSLANATISNAYYSNVAKPYGFNTDPDKWTVQIQGQVDWSQVPPTIDQWYNASQLVFPIGLWNMYLAALIGAVDTASTATNIRGTVGDSATTSDKLAFVQVTTGGATGTLYALASIDIVRFYRIRTKTTKYFNLATAFASDSISVYNSVAPMIWRLVSAYL